ncbi:MAG: hypothetical protein NMNS01_07440 [Nitrosomonas sp.]|nr:MAG: hypothetical protein NMNS01_07440 [Nitrosomonas sp.]
MIATLGARIAHTNEKFVGGHEFNIPNISSTRKFATFKQGLIDYKSTNVSLLAYQYDD